MSWQASVGPASKPVLKLSGPVGFAGVVGCLSVVLDRPLLGCCPFARHRRRKLIRSTPCPGTAVLPWPLAPPGPPPRCSRRGRWGRSAGQRIAGSRPGGRGGGHQAPWQLVRDSHYGPPKNESGYDAVLAHRDEAWFFGGTNLQRTGRPIVERWINHGWRRPVLPAGLTSWIVAASAASAKNLWAVSHLGGYVLNWANGSWAVVRTGRHCPASSSPGSPRSPRTTSGCSGPHRERPPVLGPGDTQQDLLRRPWRHLGRD
jgi:hypothetical protein